MKSIKIKGGILFLLVFALSAYPVLANFRAIALPIPEPLPVMIATLSTVTLLRRQGIIF